MTALRTPQARIPDFAVPRFGSQNAVLLNAVVRLRVARARGLAPPSARRELSRKRACVRRGFAHERDAGRSSKARPPLRATEGEPQPARSDAMVGVPG